MEPTNRRTFLKRTSVAVAATGVAAAVTPLAASAIGGAAEAESDPSVPDDASGEAVVARVRDVRTGEVVVYTGEREVTVTDKRLAATLYRHAQ